MVWKDADGVCHRRLSRAAITAGPRGNGGGGRGRRKSRRGPCRRGPGRRLEKIFSLYRDNPAISVLNRQGSLAPLATMADALSTAFSLMPLDRTLEIVRHLGIEAHFALPDGSRLTQSARSTGRQPVTRRPRHNQIPGAKWPGIFIHGATRLQCWGSRFCVPRSRGIAGRISLRCGELFERGRPVKNNLNFNDLKDKQRLIRAGFPETMGLRAHRTISWIGRAEACGEDDDARFIFLWIAFNAAYADEREFQAAAPGERAAFSDYFERLVTLDGDKRIYEAIWQRFSGPVRMLLKNRHIFNPFWQHHNGIDGFDDWEKRFEAASRAVAQAFQSGDTARVLSFVFDRLYVLRNQLVHGGSTWNSGVNRAQVRDGAAILSFLMPVFVDIMMDNPTKNWGKPFYPVVD